MRWNAAIAGAGSSGAWAIALADAAIDSAR